MKDCEKAYRFLSKKAIRAGIDTLGGQGFCVGRPLGSPRSESGVLVRPKISDDQPAYRLDPTFCRQVGTGHFSYRSSRDGKQRMPGGKLFREHQLLAQSGLMA